MQTTQMPPRRAPKPSASSSWPWIVIVLLVIAAVVVVSAIFGIIIYAIVRKVDRQALHEGDLANLAVKPPTCDCCIKCNTDKAYQCTCCQYCPSCDEEVSLALQKSTLNIIGNTIAGNAFPPDTILAVGNNDDEGRIIAVVNTVVTILNKATHQVIAREPLFFYGNHRASDGYASWDPYSNRFFLTSFNVNFCALVADVLTPPGIAGTKCSPIAAFGAQTFSLSGSIQPASSLTACGPVASLAGKIALVVRGTCGFAVKAKNVQNAGAIAMIVYNNVPGGAVQMGGSDPTVVIPAVMVSQSDGLAIAANLPVTVSLTSGADTTFSTELYISVSTTSAPNSRSDFYHYQVIDGNYSDSFADFPKHSTGPDTFYITTQNLGTEHEDFVPCRGANVRAFDKAALLDGSGADTLWDFIAPGGGVDAPQFLAPTRTNTPISDERMPDIFYGLNNGNTIGFCDWEAQTLATGFSIYGATADGMGSFVGYVPFPTPMTQGSCTDSLCNLVIANARQPEPAVPAGLELNTVFPVTGVVQDGKLYGAIVHNISAVQFVTRWFIIDVEPMAEFQDPVLLQWGDLNVSPDIDTFYPAIDVDADGVMAISFYQSGPHQHVVASYTAHFPGDPINSIRTPFHVAIPNKYVYFEDLGSGRVRYGDYTGLQIDPVDRKTFHAFMQRPDSTGFFFPPGVTGVCTNTSLCVARDWTTDLFSFRAESSACPKDGVATVPRVLSSVALPGGSPSLGNSANPEDFDVPAYFNRPEGGEEWEREFDE